MSLYSILLLIVLIVLTACTNSTQLKLSQEDCESNWAMCTLIPDKQYQVNSDKRIKVAILDSGINENQLPLKHQIYKYNAIEESNMTLPLNDHGTMIASIIASSIGKKDSFKGINNNVELYDVQVLKEDGNGKIEDIIKGINWSIEKEVDIINMSFGFDKNDKSLYKAIKEAHSQGIIIVAATGNTIGLSTNYPARYPEVISVSAIDNNLNLYPLAGKGKVDFVAPGVEIQVRNSKGKIVSKSGTSFAAAQVTGIISLMLQSHEEKQVINKLKTHSKELGEKQSYGHGLIQYKT
ncbi:chromosome partitioning protein ParA [Roseburia sp. 1XD42-34]|nr:chromosome partitioning protein ParA [Roseburia sp. 1XD42-34]RKI73933.1 chromosome partitioning protein ParA [Clostridium sp. 1xD42-85]